jgi:hypothetical protein
LRSPVEKTITLELERKLFKGTIVSPVPLRSATIFWSDSSGRIIEQAAVADDGTFSYRTHHESETTISIVSPNHPLVVQSQGDAENLTVRIPAGSPRAFKVLVQEPARFVRARVALHIGRHYVPANVLAHHQTVRDGDMRLDDEGAVTIRDILETAPITVTLGPSLEHERAISGGDDIFTHPAIGVTLPRKQLGASPILAFP